MLSRAQFSDLHGQLRDAGGFTVNVNTGKHATEGIAVALSQHERMHASATAEDLHAFARDNAGPLSTPGAHMGAWDDRAGSGHDYLDVTRVHAGTSRTPIGRAAAVGHAIKENQIASFDLSTGETITNPYHGQSPEQARESIRTDYEAAAAPHRRPR